MKWCVRVRFAGPRTALDSFNVVRLWSVELELVEITMYTGVRYVGEYQGDINKSW